jgi:uncharacterized protein (TIGR03437 family)
VSRLKIGRQDTILPHLAFLMLISSASAATFGTAVTLVGGASDLVLDEGRNRLYLVNNPQNRIEIYSIQQRRLLDPISTSAQPLSAALSLSGKYLYVASYGASSLDVIDLDTAITVNRITLPAAPEGVAVGGDDRVLITSVGTGSNANSLLIYDPNSTTGGVSSVSIVPPAPTTALVAPASGRVYISSRSQLMPSRDGRFIIGLNNPTTTSRQVFVYEVASGTVLRSRSVTSISSVLAVSADGARFMAGLTLFDTMTLNVIAQQNASNSIYLFPTNVNFNTQQNQGGSAFSPDGSVLYTAFNIAPVQTPAAAASVSQVMLNDPDNMLIKLALEVPENLVGKMVISADGSTIYAISQSGFMILPVGSFRSSPIATTSNNVVLLTNDQCGVTAQTQAGSITVQNEGSGRLTVSATLQSSTTTTNTPGLGGAGGAGGGAQGGFIPPGLPIIVIGGPGGAGGVVPGGGGNFPGTATTPGGAVTTNTASSTAPELTLVQTDAGPAFRFKYNSKNNTSLGTVTPHDFAVQSQEAIDIPPRIRVYQNNRNAEAAGTVMPVSVGVTTTEGLVDMVSDSARRLLYIANSGLNRVEVFDTQTNQFRSPIKVGQLPRSLAMSPDGGTLYVANTGGESISIIDLNQLQVTGKMGFPAIPFNASFAISTPRAIVSTRNGLVAVMSDGTNNSLWKSIGDSMTPRGVSPVIGTTTAGLPANITAPYSIAATPEGAYAILLDGNGNAYLYDAASDEFVTKQQIFTAPIQGYYGPIGAGPNGQYYLVNGTVLNAGLTPVSGPTVTVTARPVSAAVAVNANSFARFVQPVRTSATAAVTTAPTVEMVNATTGAIMGGGSVLEGPLSTQAGNTRVNISGRTMAFDAGGSNAYMLTTSGLSISPLTVVAQGGPGQGGPGGGAFPGGGGTALSNLPQVNQNGVVNVANYQTTLTPASVASVFGSNLASDATAPSTPLPNILGGACVTLNNSPVPLLLTSAGQINFQIPADLAAGKYPLVIRSIDKKAASFSQTITVSKYAPAVMVDPKTGLASIYHKKDGSLVTKDNPAQRDEALVIYASGLGPTTGGKVVTGMPSPSDTLAVTGKVAVYFGDKGYSQAPMVVNWSGLTPGQIGTYQIEITVPGNHLKGDQLPVTLTVGGVSSPTTGDNVPYVAVE